MSYIDKNLLADEQILFRTKKHIIIFFYPLVWALVVIYATQAGASYFTYLTNIYAIPVNPPMILWLTVLIFWGSVWLEYQFSDFAVTNKRVMMREGFFYRHTREMRLATVSQVDVDQSLLGQLFNYGILSINAFGAYDSFTLIAKPFTFQKYVNEQLDKITK